jgi:hypothetical protein
MPPPPRPPFDARAGGAVVVVDVKGARGGNNARDEASSEHRAGGVFAAVSGLHGLRDSRGREALDLRERQPCGWTSGGPARSTAAATGAGGDLAASAAASLAYQERDGCACGDAGRGADTHGQTWDAEVSGVLDRRGGAPANAFVFGVGVRGAARVSAGRRGSSSRSAGGDARGGRACGAGSGAGRSAGAWSETASACCASSWTSSMKGVVCAARRAAAAVGLRG